MNKTNAPSDNTDLPDTLQISKADKQISLSGDKLGRYKLGSIIGWGGAGMVYEAFDEDGSPLAIKIIKLELGTSSEEIRRFLLEAETAKKLRQHPNIITVYETGCENRTYFIAMELIKGGKTFSDLKYEENKQNPPINEILNYAVNIADALSYAHKNGILHRDIKPANVLIDEFGKAKLSDFGIAKNENAPKLTITGTIMGTPHYMSPEQCGFGDMTVTKQSDIYSFGVMLYEILTGQMPYSVHEKEQIPEILRVICSEEARSPRRIRKEISRNLEAVLLRMLDKEKKLRYKEMNDVKKDLIACREGRAVSVRRLSLAEKWEKWLRMNVQLSLSIFAGLAAALIVYFAVAAPKIKEHMYQKSRADLSEVAAKRRVFALEAELNNLKNRNEASGEAGENLKSAKKMIFEEKFTEAEKLLTELLEAAVLNSNKGMIIECSTWLGRINMSYGQYENAVEKFEKAALAAEPESPIAELANFEKAIGLQMLGKFDESENLFAKIARKNRKLDKSRHADNISRLSEAFIALNNAQNCPLDNSELEKFSDIFRGLGYWIMAQSEMDEGEKKNLIKKAVSQKNIFIWLKIRTEAQR